MLLCHLDRHQLALFLHKELFEQLHMLHIVFHHLVQQVLKVYQQGFRNHVVLLIHLYQYLKENKMFYFPNDELFNRLP